MAKPVQYRKPAQGFTLIEVMIVVVIVGILMGVALPAYQEALRKGRRVDGMDKLLEVANRQEQLMLDRSTYTLDPNELGPGTAQSDESHYDISIAACAGGNINRCYVLTATPRGSSPQNDDDRCHTFTLDSRGTKTVVTKAGTDASANNCW